MLAKKRHSAILAYLSQQGSATVSELCDMLEISESTIRRDINELHKLGMLNKVFGGAAAIDESFRADEPTGMRDGSYNAEKAAIAKKAASLVQENDFVYVDAGSTTAMMIEYLTVRRAVFVTNGLRAAAALAQRGYNVSVLAGQVRSTAGAIVGTEAINCLSRYNFNVGFFGSNGISLQNGYTNTDLAEARTKTEAMAQCQRRYILSDSRKFGVVNRITFAQLGDATLITNHVPDPEYFRRAQIFLAER
ncbi:MAG: DeoR/GlpR transcriptional regulator [Oscillospiraceae bacterium]|nr:DeoR/GlpR transcriptional regulator [Oscillospiraceae bacterium]MBP1557781.1 DeoR/GlpR transcriptional regulator [Oscillospiraceae bacterium]